MSTHNHSEETEPVKNLLSKVRSNQRVVTSAVVAVVVIVIVVVILARVVNDKSNASLCELANTDSNALLTDDESDVALVADRLRERADLIESARDGQEANVSSALQLVADSLHQLADATEADDGGKQLQELTASLTTNTDLQSAQETISEAVVAQCENQELKS